MAQKTEELPFSARYSLPAQVGSQLGEVSWETVAHLSTEMQVSAEEKSGKVKRVIKELQMSRLLLMDRIRHASKGGSIEPRLLVDVVQLLKRCESVAVQYDLDLHKFTSFLYLVSEKLKREKLAKIRGEKEIGGLSPIQEELTLLKGRSEGFFKRRKGARKAARKKARGK